MEYKFVHSKFLLTINRLSSTDAGKRKVKAHVLHSPNEILNINEDSSIAYITSLEPNENNY
jgi:hypothetical protein